VAKSLRARATRATEGWSPALAIHVSSVRCGAVNFEAAWRVDRGWRNHKSHAIHGSRANTAGRRAIQV